MNALLRCAVLIVLCVYPLFAQVTLGGKTVPKDRFLVYLFMGHSNMDGFGATLDTKTDSSLWMWDITTTNATRGDCPANPLTEPSRDATWRLSKDVGTGRMATPFLKKLKAQYPAADCSYGILQLSQWESIIPEKYLPGLCWYDRMKSFALQVKQVATIKGMVLMLGWDDGCTAQNAAAFSANAKTMITSLRTDLGMPDLPVLIGQQERDEDEKPADPVTVGHGCNVTYFPTMVTQTTKIPTLIASVEIVQSWGPYIDDHHYTTAGLNALADSAVAIIKRRGWGPQGTAVQSAAPDPRSAPSAVSRKIIPGRAVSIVFADRTGSGEWYTVSGSRMDAKAAPRSDRALGRSYR